MGLSLLRVTRTFPTEREVLRGVPFGACGADYFGAAVIAITIAFSHDCISFRCFLPVPNGEATLAIRHRDSI